MADKVSPERIEAVYQYASECFAILKRLYGAKRPALADATALKDAVDQGRFTIKGSPRELLAGISRRLGVGNEISCCGCSPATCANGTIFNLGVKVADCICRKKQLPGSWWDIEAFFCKISNERDAAINSLSGNDSEPEWSKMIGKNDLQEALGISRNTLNDRLTEGNKPIVGMIRCKAKGKNAKKIQVAIDDLPAHLKPKFSPLR